jgi:hypothetical protein
VDEVIIGIFFLVLVFRRKMDEVVLDSESNFPGLDKKRPPRGGQFRDLQKRGSGLGTEGLSIAGSKPAYCTKKFIPILCEEI